MGGVGQLDVWQKAKDRVFRSERQARHSSTRQCELPKSGFQHVQSLNGGREASGEVGTSFPGKE